MRPQRWLNPRLNLVICVISLLLKLICAIRRRSYKLKNTFQKFAQIFELRRDICRLFYAIFAEGEKLYVKFAQSSAVDLIFMLLF